MDTCESVSLPPDKISPPSTGCSSEKEVKVVCIFCNKLLHKWKWISVFLVQPVCTASRVVSVTFVYWAAVVTKLLLHCRLHYYILWNASPVINFFCDLCPSAADLAVVVVALLIVRYTDLRGKIKKFCNLGLTIKSTGSDGKYSPLFNMFIAEFDAFILGLQINRSYRCD